MKLLLVWLASGNKPTTIESVLVLCSIFRFCKLDFRRSSDPNLGICNSLGDFDSQSSLEKKAVN